MPILRRGSGFSIALLENGVNVSGGWLGGMEKRMETRPFGKLAISLLWHGSSRSQSSCIRLLLSLPMTNGGFALRRNTHRGPTTTNRVYMCIHAYRYISQIYIYVYIYMYV